VEIVAKIVKYHSSQNKTNQYTAMIVFKIINQQEIRKRKGLSPEPPQASEFIDKE